MRLTKLIGIGIFSLFVVAPAQAAVLGPQLNRSIMKDIVGQTARFRPWTKADDGGTLVVQNLRISDIIDGKGIDISLSSPDRTPAGQNIWTYSKVVVRNVEVMKINRSGGGIHNDFLMVDGLGLKSPRWTDLVIEDAYFHDGNALSTLIHAGKFNSITLRRVRVDNTTTAVQIASVDGLI